MKSEIYKKCKTITADLYGCKRIMKRRHQPAKQD